MRALVVITALVAGCKADPTPPKPDTEPALIDVSPPQPPLEAGSASATPRSSVRPSCERLMHALTRWERCMLIDPAQKKQLTDAMAEMREMLDNAGAVTTANPADDHMDTMCSQLVGAMEVEVARVGCPALVDEKSKLVPNAELPTKRSQPTP